jgi:DNA-binding response OmpR family regulator
MLMLSFSRTRSHLVHTAGIQNDSLSGIRILIVEDDYFVASECANALRNHGARVLGPVPDMPRARVALSEGAADCVLLDVNLKGEMVFELARELQNRGIPMIFTTGYDTSFLPASLRESPCLQKPVDTRELVSSVRRAVEGRGRAGEGAPN